ncbi:hypothetical protein B0H65DRAFT_63016 [Neurospora tetraspora]|uniref:Secreted protein n=1 Tax=Neurospora tetraspora TaxID=94610 RepID=A0AAE0MXH1_9PEZI|nr:hypothetical protein B0H65DRAFT_63016 [Neurospora tetraspora]
MTLLLMALFTKLLLLCIVIEARETENSNVSRLVSHVPWSLMILLQPREPRLDGSLIPKVNRARSRQHGRQHEQEKHHLNNPALHTHEP